MKVGDLLGGKYRLASQIGEGAMGVVWSATNELTRREVALKLILRSSQDLRHRLMREARACGSLSHRNIIEVLDVGTTDAGDPFLVMPRLSGETLAEMLERQRRLDPAVAAQIARDVARALEAAHAASIIHRDLKPANIFLHKEAGTEGAIVKVLDFGVSKNLAAQDTVATVAGGLVGSPAYMSPEQVRIERDLDHRTDLWSLGVILYEMLTGVRPFQGETQSVIQKVLAGPIPIVSERVRHVDRGMVDIVSRCLERDRARRFQSASELAAALADFSQEGDRSSIDGLPRVSSSAHPGFAPVASPATFAPSLERGVAPVTYASGLVSAPIDDPDDLAATRPLQIGAIAQIANKFPERRPEPPMRAGDTQQLAMAPAAAWPDPAQRRPFEEPRAPLPDRMASIQAAINVTGPKGTFIMTTPSRVQRASAVSSTAGLVRSSMDSQLPSLDRASEKPRAFAPRRNVVIMASAGAALVVVIGVAAAFSGILRSKGATTTAALPESSVAESVPAPPTRAAREAPSPSTPASSSPISSAEPRAAATAAPSTPSAPSVAPSSAGVPAPLNSTALLNARGAATAASSAPKPPAVKPSASAKPTAPKANLPPWPNK